MWLKVSRPNIHYTAEININPIRQISDKLFINREIKKSKLVQRVANKITCLNIYIKRDLDDSLIYPIFYDSIVTRKI